MFMAISIAFSSTHVVRITWVTTLQTYAFAFDEPFIREDVRFASVLTLFGSLHVISLASGKASRRSTPAPRSWRISTCSSWTRPTWPRRASAGSCTTHSSRVAAGTPRPASSTDSSSWTCGPRALEVSKQSVSVAWNTEILCIFCKEKQGCSMEQKTRALCNEHSNLLSADKDFCGEPDEHFAPCDDASTVCEARRDGTRSCRCRPGFRCGADADRCEGEEASSCRVREKMRICCPEAPTSSLMLRKEHTEDKLLKFEWIPCTMFDILIQC